MIKDSLQTLALLCRPSHGGSDFPGTEDKGCGLPQAGNGAPTPVMLGLCTGPPHTWECLAWYISEKLICKSPQTVAHSFVYADLCLLACATSPLFVAFLLNDVRDAS